MNNNNYFNDLYIYFTKSFPRIKSWKQKNALVVMTTGILNNYIYFNGHIVGYKNPDYDNLVINT